MESPRLPLGGHIDLAYRCNNNYRHCWLWLPAAASQAQDELAFRDIRRIIDDGRAMGCQRWCISGGEPMWRPDFADIFDYITRKCISYTLSTNGTRITPAIARLMSKR